MNEIWKGISHNLNTVDGDELPSHMKLEHYTCKYIQKSSLERRNIGWKSFKYTYFHVFL